MNPLGNLKKEITKRLIFIIIALVGIAILFIFFANFLSSLKGDQYVPSKVQHVEQETGRVDVPTTYAECMQVDQEYYVAKSTELECEYAVYSPERKKLNRCKELGGVSGSGPIPPTDGSQGNPPPQPENCKLRYYNPDYVFPQNFEECVQSWPESMRTYIETQGICNIAIENTTWGITNGNVANQLLQKCLAVRGEYIDYTNSRFANSKCVVWYEKEQEKPKWPWEGSVCGNNICEACESSQECCNYPCIDGSCPPPTCLGDCPRDCPYKPVQEQISVTISRADYQQGEIVKIAIQNNYSIDKLLLPQPFYTIEQFQDGEWKRVSILPCPCDVLCAPAPPYTIGPGVTQEYQWDQETDTCEGFDTISNQIGSGQYRVKVEISDVNNEESGRETVYSQLFTIQ